MTPNSDLLLERLEISVYCSDNTTLRVGQLVNVGRDRDGGYCLAGGEIGLEGVITAVHAVTKMITVCVSGRCRCYCKGDPGYGRITRNFDSADYFGRFGGSSIQVLSAKQVTTDVLGGTSYTPPSDTYVADVFINQNAYYDSYFTVVYKDATTIKVSDASWVAVDGPSLAYINEQRFFIDAVTKTVSATDLQFVYLKATSTTSGGINTPTIEVGTSQPDYTEGECHILLARIHRGRVIQEHKGPVYGIIWGDCSV